MSHRILHKTKSAPSYISYTYRETTAVTHPIYDQHHTFCLQDRIQQHTVSKKVREIKAHILYFYIAIWNTYRFWLAGRDITKDAILW